MGRKKKPDKCVTYTIMLEPSVIQQINELAVFLKKKPRVMVKEIIKKELKKIDTMLFII